MWRFLITWLVCLSANAATFYIAPSPTGNDGNPGTIGSPWATYTHANATATSGDTVLVNPGIYDQRPVMSTAGITWRAIAPVTNLSTFTIVASNIVVDGFEWTSRSATMGGDGHEAIWINGTNNIVTGVQIINNKAHDNPASQGPWLSTAGPSLYGKNATVYGLLVSNNFVYDWGAYNDAAIRLLGGATNVVVNNVISNDFGGDVFRIWGSNHIIRANIIKEHGSGIASVEGAGSNVFNQRYYFNTNLYVSFLSVSAIPYTNVLGNGYLLVDSPDPSFSNKFSLVSTDRSVTYASAPQQYGPWTLGPGSNAIISAPTMAHIIFDHPDFIQAFGVYDSGQTNLTYAYEPSVGHLIENNWIEANWNGTAGQVNSADGTNVPPSIHDWTYRNNVFINCATLSMDATLMSFHNNTWFNCGAGPSGACIAFAWNEPASASPRGEAWNSSVSNNAFIVTGEQKSSVMPYSYARVGSAGYLATINLTNDGYQKCDYNYVCNDLTGAAKDAGTVWGQAAVSKFFEPHAVNGGAFKIAYAPTLFTPFLNPILSLHPMLTSPLINAGFNLVDMTNDAEGALRPPTGFNCSIGAYEYDPTLLMRLDFACDPITQQLIQDITGNGHHAVQLDLTNWIHSIGSNPRYGGNWYTNGTMTDGISTYNKTQFGAISNINTISNLTAGTIMFWVQWNTNAIGAQLEPERYDTIMDAGDLIDFAGDPPHTTNSWAFEFGPFAGGFPPYSFYFKKWQHQTYTDTSTVLMTWSNQTRSVYTNQPYHDAVTWSVSGGTATFVGYENGAPFLTNTATMPYLQIGGASPGWICLGALQHSAPLTWPNNVNGHGGLPNAGWFKGNLSDIRIYNRALSTNEVFSIFSAASGGNISGGSPATTFTLTVTSVNPSTGVNVTLSPTSLDNVSSGSTSFTAIYNSNTTVTATAPGTIGGRTFQQWQQDGVFFTNNVAAIFVMGSAHTMESDYTNSSATKISGSATLSGNATLKNQ